MSRHNAAPLIVGIVAALLLLCGAYMVSYYALLKRTILVNSEPGPTWSFEPSYRIRTLAPLYSPAHAIDRAIRPRFWSEDAYLEEQYDESGRWSATRS